MSNVAEWMCECTYMCVQVYGCTAHCEYIYEYMCAIKCLHMCMCVYTCVYMCIVCVHMYILCVSKQRYEEIGGICLSEEYVMESVTHLVKYASPQEKGFTCRVRWPCFSLTSEIICNLGPETFKLVVQEAAFIREFACVCVF